jgi:hypothetical protein
VLGEELLNGPEDRGRELAGEHLTRHDVERRVVAAPADVDLRLGRPSLRARARDS